MKRAGLVKGGSLENAVVLDSALVLNPEGLRSPESSSDIKFCNAMPDFKLAGIEIHAFVRLHRAGHDLHSQLIAAIFRDPDNYEIIDGAADVVQNRVRQAVARVAAV